MTPDPVRTVIVAGLEQGAVLRIKRAAADPAMAVQNVNQEMGAGFAKWSG